MNNSSANYYVYNYAYFMTGELFTGTINSYATEYYLKKILEEKGRQDWKQPYFLFLNI
jgi:hypothetical protein